MAQFLDKDGLDELWSKIKALNSKKQDALVSGTNIKTISGNSLLGSGNLAYTDIVPIVTAPTSNGASLITSGGVYTAVDTLAKLDSSGTYYVDIQRAHSSSYRLKMVHGTFSVSRTSGTTKYNGSVKLASSMPNSTYQVFISRNGNMGYVNYMPYVKTKSTDSFTYYIEFAGANTDTVSFDYLAIYTV